MKERIKDLAGMIITVILLGTALGFGYLIGIKLGLLVLE